MNKITNWIKQHPGITAGIAVVIVVLILIFYIRGRVRSYNSRKATTSITKEPTINTDEVTREYEVDNSNAAAIFGIIPGEGNSGAADSAMTAPAPAPTPVPIVEEKPKQKPKAKPKTTPAAAEVKAPIPSSTANDVGGALAEMERREKAAAEKARAAENVRVREERDRRLAAEAKAAELEAQMRKPKFNFTIVEERGDFGNIDFPDKSKKTQDKEILYAAKIYGTQRIKSGDPVTLRNTEIIQYGKNKMPVGSIIYGIAQQSGNRMNINLSNVQTRDGKFPILGLSVCDFDMVKGIYLKEYEDLSQDEASESVIEEVGSSVPNQLVGTIATATTKQIQKNINKQQKIVITLEDNYEVYVAVPTK
jgi:hypothetical protein